MFVPFVSSCFADTSYGQPEQPLENLYAEQSDDMANRNFRLVNTPGLDPYAEGLNGPVRGLFQGDAIIGGQIIMAAGYKVYAVDQVGITTELGALTGTDKVRFASSQADLVVVADGKARLVTGASVGSAITVGAAGNGIIDVTEINQVHVYLEANTGRFWWSDPAEPETVSNASFATTETEPDNVVAVRSLGNSIYLFGTTTVERWVYTGSFAEPFITDPGGVVQQGIVGRDAIAQDDFALFCTGANGLVYRVDGSGIVRISNHSVERLIQSVSYVNRSLISMSSHVFGGHTFIGLYLPDVGDFFFDVATQLWHRRRTTQATHYKTRDFLRAWGRTFAGADAKGSLYELKSTVSTEDGDPVRRVASAIVPVDDGRPVVSNLVVEAQAGIGNETGDGVDPQLMLTFARDGKTFGTEITRSLGKQGEYSHRCRFGKIGALRPPYAVFRIAVSDPVTLSLYGLTLDAARA